MLAAEDAGEEEDGDEDGEDWSVEVLELAAGAPASSEEDEVEGGTPSAASQTSRYNPVHSRPI